ncbi:hypothetical protein CN220_34405 [Sinorhizobium meliloti]|nr:hypothetical protein CN220_34405 [Sinorhizobium meliloti]
MAIDHLGKRFLPPRASAEAGEIAKDYPVECKEREAEIATEISLAENVMHALAIGYHVKTAAAIPPSELALTVQFRMIHGNASALRDYVCRYPGAGYRACENASRRNGCLVSSGREHRRRPLEGRGCFGVPRPAARSGTGCRRRLRR